MDDALAIPETAGLMSGPDASSRTGTLPEISYEQLCWLRALCREGPLDEWPPTEIIEALVTCGLVLQRFGAIGPTSEGRTFAAIR